MSKDISAKLAACEASLKRWHSRLIRATNAIGKLEKQRRRLLAASHWEAQVKHAIEAATPTVEQAVRKAISTDSKLDIPAFLDRSNPAVAEEMTTARKKAEAEARKKMPLSGKAALEAVKPKRKAQVKA